MLFPAVIRFLLRLAGLRPVVLPSVGPLSARLPGRSLRVPSLSERAIRLLAITMTMTFVLATVIGTTGLVNRRSAVALGASTTLTVISGEVTARASDSEEFHPIADGETLHAGMTIRTGPGTYAVLTYFEGSTVSLDPETTLVIEALSAETDGSTIITMRQEIGRTWHSVAKLLQAGSRYEVKTPTATATVRGTMFEVGVELDPQGEIVSRVETTEGAVATSKAPTPQEPQPKEEVIVRPGFEVSVTKNAPLPPPKPAPEPQRTVTVTVSAAAGIVLDPVGRANGIKDGKIVVQTPGAVVQKVDGKLVIKLPDIPDGRLATVIDPKQAGQAPVDVITSVVERGQPARTADQKADIAAAAGPPVVEVELRKGGPVQVDAAAAEKTKIVASVKVAAPPPLEPVVSDRSVNAASGSANAASGSAEQRGRGEKRGGGDGPSGPGGGPGGAGGPGGPVPPGIATNSDTRPVTGFVPIIEMPALPSVVTASEQSGTAPVVDTDDQRGAPAVRDTGPHGQGGPSKGRDQPGANASGGANGAKAGDGQRGGDAPKARPAAQTGGNAGRVIDAPKAADPQRGAPVQQPGDAPKTVGGAPSGDSTIGTGSAVNTGGSAGSAPASVGGSGSAANAGTGAGSGPASGGGAGGSTNAGSAAGNPSAGAAGGASNAGGGAAGGGPANSGGGGSGAANAGSGAGGASANTGSGPSVGGVNTGVGAGNASNGSGASGGQVTSDQPTDTGGSKEHRKGASSPKDTSSLRGFVPDISLPALPSLGQGGPSGDDDPAPARPSKDRGPKITLPTLDLPKIFERNGRGR